MQNNHLNVFQQIISTLTYCRDAIRGFNVVMRMLPGGIRNLLGS